MGGVERLSMRRARFVVLAVLVAAVTVRVVSGGTSAAPPLDGQAAGLQRSLPSRTVPALPNRRAHADADTAPNVHAPAHSAALAPAAVTPGGTDGQPRAHHADERPLADWERDDNRAIGTWPPPVAAPPCEGSGRSAPSPVTGAPSPTSRARSARCSRRSGGRPRPP